MKSLAERLATYAEHHRDKRNIATHFLGIPMIVVGTQSLLARVGIGPFNAAVGATALMTRYYRQLDPTYGAVLGGLLGASCAVATGIAQLPLPMWLGTAGGLFIGGWALQFLGHKLEGSKPAFFDDLMGLVIGPVFLVAEAAFALGMSGELRAEVEARLAGANSEARASA
jgi:uncharacterized membrane protein YGL010W